MKDPIHEAHSVAWSGPSDRPSLTGVCPSATVAYSFGPKSNCYSRMDGMLVAATDAHFQHREILQHRHSLNSAYPCVAAPRAVLVGAGRRRSRLGSHGAGR